MQERRDETHQRLLEAAADCFSANGYDATGVAEICRHAGVSKGGFYHHFASKQAIFLELLEHWLGALDERLAQIRDEASSVPDALQRMVDTFDHVLQSAQGRLPIFFEFMTKAQRDPAVWAATIAPYRRYRAFFAEMIRQGISEGSFQNVDADAAALSVVSLAVGVMLQSLLDPQGENWAESAEKSIRILLDVLQQGGTRDLGEIR